MTTKIHELSAAQLSDAYRSRDLSPVDVTRAMLDRIDQVDPKINAFCHVDGDAAMQSARESEARWTKGAPLDPLDGVPTAVKDGLALKGVPIYRGSLANAVKPGDGADTDFPAVARLKDAGLVILGKTTMCDYGILAAGYSSKFGPTRNPHDLSRSSSGSSSGSAAAVAAGIGPVSIGTDIVGSIRHPASFCGLFGLKPTYGRVPWAPLNSPSVVAGPMARDVRDGALFMNVLARPDPRDVTALPYDELDYTATLDGDIGKVRIGYMPEMGFGPSPDPEVSAKIRDAVEAFSGLGAEIVPLDPPFTPEDLETGRRFYQVRSLTELLIHDEETQRSAEVIYNWSLPARDYSAADHYADGLGLQVVREKFIAAMGDLDFVLMPSVPVLPYAAENPGLDDGDIFAPWCNTFVMNLTHQPAASVSCGFSKGGLPIGLQIIGRRYDDAGVFRAAAAYEKAACLPVRVPDLT